MQYHKYTLADLDSMIPFERELYVAMLIEYLEQERMAQQQANAGY